MLTTARDEESIFAEALEKKPGEERGRFLDALCDGDAALRARIEKLLKSHSEAGSFLGRPPDATVDQPPPAERPGTVIGPYKLLEQIGEGGMGTVFMAEQTEPVRRMVALKVIKPGMDSAQVVARFEAERQALALMDHPNIARVLDAGTTISGHPYFVMELVKGVPITKFADENQLTPRGRLELFVQVCQAVQHAHQKGIIHRDLKPSNVLVALYDDKPVPKVIDFGIAKATSQKLTERTLFTGFGTYLGTLEYMSPEQARLNALDVDSRSDVYSLGVLLYELLTGTTPLEPARLKQEALDELLRIIREEEPPRPSTRLSASGKGLAVISSRRGTEPVKLGNLVRGELDWIVMRCLEKDRTRRYETANGLARDVERYLKDEPVEACPPTAGYRLRKFARKHRRMLATAAAFAALLLLGVAASAWQAVRATQAEAVANANAMQAQDKEQEANKERDEAQRQRDEVRALNDRLQRTLYRAEMNLAQHAWEAGSADRVRELLELHRPKPGESDLRGFEWNYLYRLSHADLLTLKGDTDDVHSVTYSPDGKRLASASSAMLTGRTGEVKVWDAQTGQVLLTLKGCEGVAFSPDGKRLASAGQAWDHIFDVKVWDAQTGQELVTLKGHTRPVCSVAFSPDGRRLASASSDKTVKVWDAQTGQELLTLKGGGGSSVAFSPDGKRLAGASGDKTVRVWDAQTGQEVGTLKGRHGPIYNGVAFSPDGKRLAGASNDKTVTVWDAQTGQELLTLQGHADKVVSVTFSPDGKRLASASHDRAVKVWDAQTGQELFTLKGHSNSVWKVAFSPDGKRLASASSDKTVKVWDAQTGPNPLTLKGGASSIASVAFSPDGKRLASISVDRDRREPGEGKVWDAQTGQELFTLQALTAGVKGKAFRLKGTVTYSPDGKLLAAASLGGSRDGEVKVLDAQTGKELRALRGHTRYVTSVAFSPDGTRLASASDDKTVKVWDVQTGQQLLTLQGHTDSVWCVAFSPDGTRLASASGYDDSKKGEVKIWDARTGQGLVTLKGHIGGVHSVAFSPDGQRLASASWNDTVKVWDARTGKELLTLKGHSAWVAGVAFSPDGKRLASTSRDKTVKVWDAQTGQELLTLQDQGGGGHTGICNGVAFSPDGHRLASGAEEGTVKIWDATPLPEKPSPKAGSR